MSIGAKEAALINKMNRIAMQIGLGDLLKELWDSSDGGADERLDALELLLNGTTQDDGLAADVAALLTAVGDSESGAVKDIADLQTAVGDSESGLVADVAALETAVGDAESGLVADVATLDGDVTELQSVFVTHTLIADDIAAGVATVDTLVDFTAWYSVMVTTALGVPRAITKIEKGGEGHETEIIITATDVAATDIVSVIVK